MWVIRAGIHKLPARIANREDPGQTASPEAVWSGSALFHSSRLGLEAIGYLPTSFWLNWVYLILNWVFQVFVLGIHLKAKQWNRALFLLIFCLLSVSLLESSISEVAISNLLLKSNVSIKSSLIPRITNAVLELVMIWYYSIALGLFRPPYAIVIVKRDECRNRVNIGYS